MPHIRDFEPILPDPQPYVERALALYESAVREKRGRVVFIAAELGGGKTEHLNALAEAIHQAKPAPNFIAGFFKGGEYSRYTLDWQEYICLKKTMLAAGETASLLSLFPHPYAFAASLVGQLLQTSVSTHEFGSEFKKNPRPREESADWLRKLLRHAAEEKPLVCLLDDWDEAKRFYWDDMLLSFAKEIARLPLLLFITVKEPIDLAAPEKDESGLTRVIKTLVEKGLAEWWPLRKLSRDEVAAAIGQAAPGIAAKLHGMTGGNARWVRKLWREWRLSEIVVTNEADCWVWGERHKTTVNLYEDILSDRLRRLLKAETAMEVEEAREVLTCAALEGVRFTADAVARALAWDRDELIDFLDDALVQTEDNPDGLLFEDDSITITMPDGSTRTLWRYGFVSDLQWLALERDGFVNEQRPDKSDSERLAKSAALAEALMETYAPEERLIAASLARLLRGSGRKETAQHYQRMADYATGREVMREHALYILTINKDDWEQWQCGRAAKFLIEAGREMIGAFPYHETLAVLEEAHKLARRAKYEDDEAHARYLCGFILCAEGEYKAARESAQDSLNIFRRIRKKSGTASSLNVLAEIDYNEGHYAEARAQAAQSLESNQEIGNRHGMAISLNLLAKIDYNEGRYAEARAQAAQSLESNQEIGNRHGMAVSLNLLAQIDYNEGRYAEARAQAAQVLEIAQEMGNRHGMAASLNVLAEIDYNEGHYAEARAQAAQSLEIDQEIGNRHGMAVSLSLLAQIDYNEGRYAEARTQAAQVLEIAQEIGNRHGMAVSLSLLAQIDYTEGHYAEARAQAAQSLESNQEIGDRLGMAVSLNLLSAVACKFERPNEAVNLMTLGTLILTQIGHADAQNLGGDLTALLAEQKYTEEQQRELLQQVSEAYRKDDGKELIENALTSLREAGS